MLVSPTTSLFFSLNAGRHLLPFLLTLSSKISHEHGERVSTRGLLESTYVPETFRTKSTFDVRDDEYREKTENIF
jgi:hypothetical protein